MKKNCLLLGLIAVFAMFSCNNGKNDKGEGKQVVCDVENSIVVTVQDYYYEMSDTLVYNTPEFKVVSSDYEWVSDSLVTLRLSNYDPKVIVGERTAEQIDINIKIKSKNGEKITPGYYGNDAYDEGRWCNVTMSTAYGIVYFNWYLYMPKAGGITIEYIGEDAICGTFNLNNEKPKFSEVGIVRLNGTFVHKN